MRDVWTLEFWLVLWVWIIFVGCAFVVRDRDHVIFDILYNAVRPATRRWFIVIGGAIIATGLALSIEPIWGKFHILRLKQTATLKQIMGDWIRMRDVYSVYMLFLPTCRELDIDLVHFGVVAVVNCMIGLITPPYGILLFVINAVTRIPPGEIIREVWPFLLVLISALLVLTIFPRLVLWLPWLFGYPG